MLESLFGQLRARGRREGGKNVEKPSSKSGSPWKCFLWWNWGGNSPLSFYDKNMHLEQIVDLFNCTFHWKIFRLQLLKDWISCGEFSRVWDLHDVEEVRVVLGPGGEPLLDPVQEPHSIFSSHSTPASKGQRHDERKALKISWPGC